MSATSIEADGVAEGFMRSVELHNLKFNRLIGKIYILLYMSVYHMENCFFAKRLDSLQWGSPFANYTFYLFTIYFRKKTNLIYYNEII